MKMEQLYWGSCTIKTTELLDKNIFNRDIKSHMYDYVLTSLDTMGIPQYLEKCKSDIRKRITHLDRYCKITAMDRSRMTQKIDPYDLYYVFEYDDFEYQGMRYDDNNFRVVSKMLHRKNRITQYTGHRI